jgi:hypothetical protein
MQKQLLDEVDKLLIYQNAFMDEKVEMFSTTLVGACAVGLNIINLHPEAFFFWLNLACWLFFSKWLKNVLFWFSEKSPDFSIGFLGM